MKYITHTPRKSDFVIWAVCSAVILIPSLSGFVLVGEDLLLILPLGILSFFMFNLLIRRSLTFKNYFISPINVLTSKMRSEVSMSIPKDLMFDKMIEVINDSKFKLTVSDKSNYEILATTGISWFSWGENIYISIEGEGEKTTMKICSVTFFQVYSWGRNERNYNDLLRGIEESLTV